MTLDEVESKKLAILTGKKATILRHWSLIKIML